ncbi:MAG TPA: hypothetical protein VKR79_08245 [Gaiellaceae bacterium]|nr:hypothetical protein [Gaiellaceae bacterium]
MRSPRWQLLILALAAALAVPTAASAACTGRSSDQHYWSIGYSKGAISGHHYDYVKSNIVVRNPVLDPNCSTWHCYSYAWIMMLNSGQDQFAQTGVYKDWEFSYGNVFDQCVGNKGTKIYDNWLIEDNPVGTAPLYTIHYGTDPLGNADNKIFLQNGTIIDYCGGGGSPFTFTPVYGEGVDEIYDLATQIPGSVASHESFTNGIVTDPVNGTTGLFTGSVGAFEDGSVLFPIPSWMGDSNGGSESQDYWDADCS